MTRRALVAIGAMYFACTVAGIAYAYLDQGARRRLAPLLGGLGTSTDVVDRTLVNSLQAPERLIVALDIALFAFLGTLLVSSLLYITMISTLVPFGGIPVGLARAFYMGILLVEGDWYQGSVVSVAPVLVLEGLGYVVAMAGVWSWWRSVLVAYGGRRTAYLQGLRQQPKIYLSVACWLAAAAVYQSIRLAVLGPL